MSQIDDIRMMAEANGLTFKDCGNGHVQILGHGALVNYWPESKARTAFVNHTRERQRNCTPWDAVKLCLSSAGKGMKPNVAKKIAKNRDKQAPAFSLKPVKTNPAGIKNFYNGERPPWEFKTTIMCQSDRLRIAAHRIVERAEQMETEQ